MQTKPAEDLRPRDEIRVMLDGQHQDFVVWGVKPKDEEVEVMVMDNWTTSPLHIRLPRFHSVWILKGALGTIR